MSEQRTVGSLTADDLGSMVEVGVVSGPLVSVDHALVTRMFVRGVGEVRVEHAHPCTVTPGGPAKEAGA